MTMINSYFVIVRSVHGRVGPFGTAVAVGPIEACSKEHAAERVAREVGEGHYYVIEAPPMISIGLKARDA